ncbi:MAG: type II secretion system GspH family protein [Pseudomonadales bacterium]|nr:type II secretion system GspH family protein [Pseudomonadales bacterium]
MKRRVSGFTLVEFVMVIVITSILSSIIFRMLILPIHAFDDMSRRSELVSLAESALVQMSRDLKSAVPNSVRVAQQGGIYSVELLRATASGRYRYAADDYNKDNLNKGALYNDGLNNKGTLSPGRLDSAFNILASVGSIDSGSRIVINSKNTEALYAAAESGVGGIITPLSTSLSLNFTKEIGAEKNMQLSRAFQFDRDGQGSPRKWFYVSDTAITYRCDLSTGKIHRYVNYPVASLHSLSVPKNADSNIVVNSVSHCDFSYNKGAASVAGLVTLLLTLSDDKERISVVRQVPINNET